MNTHRYLKAYVAGIFVPTLVLPLILTGYIVVRLVLAVPVPIERFLVFPIAVVPVLFGLWNMLYVKTHESTGLPIGVYGAVLPVLGAPTGAMIAHCLGMLGFGARGIDWFRTVEIPYALVGLGLAVAVTAYYLVWKYIVSFMNRVVGIG